MSPQGGNREKITIEEIATALGVSKTTVSRALSGKGRIGEATRARVFAYVSAAGRSAGASGPEYLQKTHNIALAIPPVFLQLDLPYLRHSMSGVCRVADERGYDVLICYADVKNTEQLERQLKSHKVDGVLFPRALGADPCLEIVRRYNIPYVVMGRLPNTAILQVDNDQTGAAREMTSLLLRMGQRRIAFLCGGMDMSVNNSRLTGYLRGMADAGRNVEPGLVYTDILNNEQLLNVLDVALENQPDCLLCGDDSIAIFCAKVLRQRGVEVPKQLRLASLYDNDLLQEMTPSVTAVQFDAENLGAEACRLLLDTLAGKQVQSRAVEGYQVVLRESTKHPGA